MSKNKPTKYEQQYHQNQTNKMNKQSEITAVAAGA